jgi:hypothetical protein
MFGRDRFDESTRSRSPPVAVLPVGAGRVDRVLGSLTALLGVPRAGRRLRRWIGGGVIGALRDV